MNYATPNYRILVLYNPLNRMATTLPTAVSIAKKTGAAIDILSVSSLKPLKDQSNQVALIRIYKDEKKRLKSHLSSLVDILVEEENISVIYNAKVGVIKDLVQEHIRLTKPDVVILGNHKGFGKQWINSNLLNTVLDHHSGVTLLASSNTQFNNNKTLKLGFVNEFSKQHPFLQSLSRKSNPSYKLFQFSSEKKHKKHDEKEEVVVYDFEDKASMFSNFLRYIEASNLSILCIQKALFSNKNLNSFNKKIIINKLSNLGAPILVLPN